MVVRAHCIAVLLLLAFAAGCAKQQEPAKRYPLSGKVVSTDAGASQVVVDAKDIPGFMEAMTMGYKVKDASVLKSLAPGDEITADVVVQGANYWLENIQVTKKAGAPPPQALHSAPSTFAQVSSPA
jgi:Cu/Ag efflux protein CusF